MLVLSRLRDEEVVIDLPTGERVKLVVVDIRGDTVRLGFEADKSVTIHRMEVWRAVEAEKRR